MRSGGGENGSFAMAIRTPGSNSFHYGLHYLGWEEKTLKRKEKLKILKRKIVDYFESLNHGI